jgi:hypothetical protein
MNLYVPNEWAVVKIKTSNGEYAYKVFGGWFGGYTTGDRWRLNSGITKAVRTRQEDYYNSKFPDAVIIDFHGYSGSIYRVNKDSYGLGGFRADVLNQMVKEANEKYGEGAAEIMPADTDWLNFNYEGKYDG